MNAPPLDVWLIATDGLLLLDLAGPAEALRLAGEAHFRLRFAGPQPRANTLVGAVLADLAPLPEQITGPALVLVPGHEPGNEGPGSEAVVGWLRRVLPQPGVQLATVCAGALYAARAGLLDGRRCTTHYAHAQELQTLAPAAKVEADRVFVQDGPVWTSAGVTAGIDLALQLIATQVSPQVAADVARRLVVYFRRGGDDPQLSAWFMHRNHLHPLVHRVQEKLAHDVAADWSLEAMAELVHVTPRHLSRLFREHAQVAPAEYLRLLRVAQAQALLADSRLPMERVAELSGFGSARDLRRVLARARQ
ncbi:transcriptional regulator GlxA family with amidase domain [Silvimonas terrae]|uniref:Transcriptional regulator GlxA family with amidase domain n=1 Tax=Silvimonas terrae TaxID=300266 RepID=A0A840RIZ4_9NEIS|nr:helix-turn-helix domain-containing protein [Silvimonas terrae]MBB5193087.1 transcriptional regulator GlxA family with amidase domain [Silvimonas terrae]